MTGDRKQAGQRGGYLRPQSLPWIGLLVSGALLAFTVAVASAESVDFTPLVGRWVRPDGGYIIHVRSFESDGRVAAGYFNPRQIRVAEARASRWKGLLKLFIKLQDKGYPGSTYTLYYYAEKDALAGFYYQAAMDRTYEVVFVRKSE